MDEVGLCQWDSSTFSRPSIDKACQQRAKYVLWFGYWIGYVCSGHVGPAARGAITQFGQVHVREA